MELFVFGPYKPYFFVDLSVFASRDSKVIGRQGYVMNIIHLIIYIYTHTSYLNSKALLWQVFEKGYGGLVQKGGQCCGAVGRNSMVRCCGSKMQNSWGWRRFIPTPLHHLTSTSSSLRAPTRKSREAPGLGQDPMTSSVPGELCTHMMRYPATPETGEKPIKKPVKKSEVARRWNLT